MCVVCIPRRSTWHYITSWRRVCVWVWVSTLCNSLNHSWPAASTPTVSTFEGCKSLANQVSHAAVKRGRVAGQDQKYLTEYPDALLLISSAYQWSLICLLVVVQMFSGGGCICGLLQTCVLSMKIKRRKKTVKFSAKPNLPFMFHPVVKINPMLASGHATVT